MADMNRRGFLGRLLAGVAAMAAAPAIDLAEALGITPEALPTATIPTYGDLFTRLCYEALSRFEGHLGRTFTLVEGGLGQNGLTEQYGIDLDAAAISDDSPFNDIVARYIDPAMAALAQRCDGVTCFGKLPLPMAVNAAQTVTIRSRGISLRGLHDLDIYKGRQMLRFDVLVGRA